MMNNKQITLHFFTALSCLVGGLLLSNFSFAAQVNSNAASTTANACVGYLRLDIPSSILYRSKNLIQKYFVPAKNMPTSTLCPGAYTVALSVSWAGISGQQCSHSNSTYCHFWISIDGPSKNYLLFPNGSDGGYCSYGASHQNTAIYKDYEGYTLNRSFTYNTADGPIYAPQIVAEGGFNGGTMIFTHQ